MGAPPPRGVRHRCRARGRRGAGAAAPARVPRRPPRAESQDGGPQSRVRGPPVGIPVRRQLVGPVRLTDPTLSRRGRGYTVTQAPVRRGEVVRGGPFRLTSAGRTLLDCARQWQLDDAVVAVGAAPLARTGTAPQLRGRGGALRGWAGAPGGPRGRSPARGGGGGTLGG